MLVARLGFYLTPDWEIRQHPDSCLGLGRGQRLVRNDLLPNNKILDFLITLFVKPERLPTPVKEYHPIALEAPNSIFPLADISLKIVENEATSSDPILDTKGQDKPQIQAILPPKTANIKAIEAQIIATCEKYDLDPLLPLNIAWSESFFQNVPNHLYDGETGKYTAYGIFQETRTFYKTNCGNPDDRLIIKNNIDCAIKVMKTKGYYDWLESYELNGKGWRYLPYKTSP